MKTINTWIAATTCIFAGLLNAHADLHSGQATVKQLKGAAHYSAAEGVWVPLQVNTALKSGMLIKTAPESSVTLIFKDSGGTLTANANTILRLTKLASGQTGLESVSDTDLELIEGSVAGSQKKASSLSHFQINEFVVPSGSSYEIASKGTLTVAPLKEMQPVAVEPAVAKIELASFAVADRPVEKPTSDHGNNGVGNGEDPAPPGNPKPNDGPGTGPGNPGNGRPPRP